MRTVILCGGRGTRAYPRTREVPKPLLEVAGRPVLHHLLDIYAGQGFTDFVLAAGYLAHEIVAFARDLPHAWTVEVIDTGEDTATGERLLRCRDAVSGTFLANYADGLADVDLPALLATHRAHAGCATLTSVPLPSPYGTLELGDDGQVTDFHEKPALLDHRINGGYFVFDDVVFDRWTGTDLEREVLPALAKTGQLHHHRHEGFWRSLDTYKDALELSELAAGPWSPPWRR